MCNMCNRCNCGCRSNQCGCNRCQRCSCANESRNSCSSAVNNGCGCNAAYDETAMWEAECMAHEIEMRRNRENQCARQFTRCIKNTRCW